MSLVDITVPVFLYVIAEFKEAGNETVFGDCTINSEKQCSFEEPNKIFESNSYEEKCQTSYLSDVDIDFYEVMYTKVFMTYWLSQTYFLKN